MVTERDLTKAVIARLKNEYHYPMGDILMEYSASFGMARYRPDIVVMSAGKPYIVIEVKTDIDKIPLEQLRNYVRATGAIFAVASDGLSQKCFMIDKSNYELTLAPVSDIPRYGQQITSIGTHSNQELIVIDSQRYIRLIWEITDLYRGLFSTEEAIRDIAKILLLKVYDEKRAKGQFRAKIGELPEIIQSRLMSLSNEAKRDYPIALKDPVLLKGEPLVQAVQVLQKYCIIESANDIVGSKLSFSKLAGAKSSIQKMPNELPKLIIELLQISPQCNFVDPNCGIGDLLVEAAKKGAIVTGFESNETLAQLAQISLALSDLKGDIIVKSILRSDPDNEKYARGYAFAAIYPHFGVKIDSSTFNEYFLGSNKKSQSSEALLLEKTLSVVQPGGRVAIIVPEGFMFVDSSYQIREFILRSVKIRAIISLPPGCFEQTSIKTSVILIEKPFEKTAKQDWVFVSTPSRASQFDQVISDYKKFIKNDFGPHFDISDISFPTSVENPNNFSADYLRKNESDFIVSFNELTRNIQSSGIQPKSTTEVIELRDLVTFTSGVRLDDIGERDSNGDIRYIKAGNVGEFTTNMEDAERFTPKKDIARWKPSPGDLLLTRAGTVGRVALVKDEQEYTVVGLNVVKLFIRDKRRLLPEYLLAFLASKQGQEQIKLFTGGLTIRNISISALGQIKMPLPPIEKQEEISASIKELIETKAAIAEEIANLKAKETLLVKKINNKFGV